MKKSILIIFSSFMLLVVPSGPAFGALVAYYSFDGNTNDTSGNGLNGSIAGTGSSYVAGNIGQALSLPGGPPDDGGAYVDLPSGINTNSAEGTIAGWTKWNSIGGFSRFFDFGIQGNAIFVEDNNIYKQVKASTPGGDTSGINIDTGKWYFIALVTGPAGATLYVYNADGTILGQEYSTSTSSFSSISGSYWLGRSHWESNGDYRFNGLLDDVRIYDTALTQSEIAALAAPVPIPAALWLFGAGLLGLIGVKRKTK